MAESDSEISIDDGSTTLMSRLTKPLFNGGRQSEGVSLIDVNMVNETLLYAVTVNIQPTKFINKRQWKKYSADQQKAILTRIERSVRTKNPSIVLKALHFEVCPTLFNIHFHAMYQMPNIYQVVLETYYDRVVGQPQGKQTKPWRHFLMEEIYDRKGWLEYITKDL